MTSLSEGDFVWCNIRCYWCYFICWWWWCTFGWGRRSALLLLFSNDDHHHRSHPAFRWPLFFKSNIFTPNVAWWKCAGRGDDRSLTCCLFVMHVHHKMMYNVNACATNTYHSSFWYNTFCLLKGVFKTVVCLYPVVTKKRGHPMKRFYGCGTL